MHSFPILSALPFQLQVAFDILLKIFPSQVVTHLSLPTSSFCALSYALSRLNTWTLNSQVTGQKIKICSYKVLVQHAIEDDYL